MKNCPTLQKSLDWCEGMPQYPGFRRRVYYCNKSLVVAWPQLITDELGRADSALLEGNFELAEDAYWQYLDVNTEKSSVTSEPIGEPPSQLQLNKATFVHNGIDARATEVAALLNYSDNVFVYEDTLGHFRVLGNKRWHTKTTVSQDQGQGNNPANTVINVETADAVAPPYYNGSLLTEDGEVFPHASDNSGGGDEPQPFDPGEEDIFQVGGLVEKVFMPMTPENAGPFVVEITRPIPVSRFRPLGAWQFMARLSRPITAEEIEMTTTIGQVLIEGHDLEGNIIFYGFDFGGKALFGIYGSTMTMPSQTVQGIDVEAYYDFNDPYHLYFAIYCEEMVIFKGMDVSVN